MVWWNVWSSHPTSTTLCGCGDSSLLTWFIAWPAYAMAHGLDPFYSTAMFHPSGVNLLSNTGVLAIGVPLAPITWVFGPVASFNVALTLIPVLSALAMFVLVRRWVRWQPAAFVAGLVYGFSPFIFTGLVAGWMTTLLVIPPLIVACLDELLFRQRARPVLVGVVLGVLVTIQFFIGTEVLTITAIGVAVGLVVVLGYARRQADDLRARARYAGVGALSATGTAVVLLAYPAWFALAGPAHLSGLVWPGGYPGYGGTTLKDYLLPTPAGSAALAHTFGGYQGATLSGQYLGIGLMVVVLGGVAVWRHDRRLWFFGAMAVLSVPLSIGLETGHWVPWEILVRIPLIQNIVPNRFLVITFLSVAVLFGLIVDHAVRATAARLQVHRSVGVGSRRRPRPAVASWLVGLAVAAIGLVPIWVYLSPTFPITTEPVVVPAWFRTVAPRLPDHQVLLVYPVPFALQQSVMTWQAIDQMHFSIVGGGGPTSALARGGKERAGQVVLSKSSLATTAQVVTQANVLAVRRAMDDWGVTMAVVPDQSALPFYQRVRSVPSAVALLTAATGERPIYQAHAWVWTSINLDPRAVTPGPAAYAACLAGTGGAPASPARVSACIVAHPAS
jgi:hypothetical protein